MSLLGARPGPTGTLPDLLRDGDLDLPLPGRGPTARTALDLVPRLAGATALARRDRLGPRPADLGVHVRQHHAERDLAALGARLLEEPR